MIHPRFAVLGALLLLLGWLGATAWEAKGDLPTMALSLSDSAAGCNLPGLAARGYLLAAQIERKRLYAAGFDRNSPDGKRLLAEIITTRLAAARLLLQAGYLPAAEAIALEGAQADYANPDARALLLEIRLRGPAAESARRDLMLLLLKQPQPQLLSLLGSTFARQGLRDDARACFERGLALSPDHVPTLLALADLDAAEAKRAAAATLVQKAVAVASSPQDKRLALAAQAQLCPDAGRRWLLVRAWWQFHQVSLLLGLAYALFLLSPAWLGLRRRRGN